MIEYVFIGTGFALAAALQPGPLQAYLFSSVTRWGWRKTLPAALAPVISDGPIAVLVLFILARFPEDWNVLLQAAGGLLLLFFAWSSIKQWKAWEQSDVSEQGSAPQTMLQATLVNLLNPNPYLGWSLVLGPAAIKAWAEAPSRAIVLVGAFYLTIVVATMGVIMLFGLSSFLDENRRRQLIFVSAIILAALGTYQLASSITSVQGFLG